MDLQKRWLKKTKTKTENKTKTKMLTKKNKNKNKKQNKNKNKTKNPLTSGKDPYFPLDISDIYCANKSFMRSPRNKKA